VHVSGEPDYVDQVPRKLAYERAHPAVTINYRRTHWQAIVPHENGESVVTRMSLRGLMDALDKLGEAAVEGRGTSSSITTAPGG
jgi:hypothetical protein